MFRASEPTQRTATILIRGEKSGSLIVQITHAHLSPKFDPECYHESQSVLSCARTRVSHDFDTTNLPSQCVNYLPNTSFHLNIDPRIL